MSEIRLHIDDGNYSPVLLVNLKLTVSGPSVIRWVSMGRPLLPEEVLSKVNKRACKGYAVFQCNVPCLAARNVRYVQIRGLRRSKIASVEGGVFLY